MENFKQQVRIGLAMKNMTLCDLAEKVTEKTGLYCDQSLLSKILNSQKRSERIAGAIIEILELQNHAVS